MFTKVNYVLIVIIQVDHSSAAAGTAAGTSASSAAWLSDSDDSTDEAGVRRGKLSIYGIKTAILLFLLY